MNEDQELDSLRTLLCAAGAASRPRRERVARVLRAAIELLEHDGEGLPPHMLAREISVELGAAADAAEQLRGLSEQIARRVERADFLTEHGLAHC